MDVISFQTYVILFLFIKTTDFSMIEIIQAARTRIERVCNVVSSFSNSRRCRFFRFFRFLLFLLKNKNIKLKINKQ